MWANISGVAKLPIKYFSPPRLRHFTKLCPMPGSNVGGLKKKKKKKKELFLDQIDLFLLRQGVDQSWPKQNSVTFNWWGRKRLARRQNGERLHDTIECGFFFKQNPGLMGDIKFIEKAAPVRASIFSK
jgi:hypothetical protein